jgi:hypothetical protein
MTEHLVAFDLGALEKALVDARANDGHLEGITGFSTNTRFNALDVVIHFLDQLGVAADLTAPLREMLGECYDQVELANLERARGHQSGRRPRSANERMRLLIAAATVTMLHKRCSYTVGAAASKAAKISGIDQKDIRNFRDQLHRGLTDPEVKEAYERTLRELGKLPDTQFEERALKGLTFCK